MAVSEDRKFTKEQVYTLLEGAKGKTLGEVDKSHQFARTLESKKITGIAGDVIEQSVFGYKKDSKQECDIEIDGVLTEVKTTGVRVPKRDQKNANGKTGEAYNVYLGAKEGISITHVTFEPPIQTDFDTSHFWEKTERLLIIFYEYKSYEVVPASGYAKFPIVDYCYNSFSQEEKDKLQNDWEIVSSHLQQVYHDYQDAEKRNEQLVGFTHLLRPNLLLIELVPGFKRTATGSYQKPRYRLKQTFVDYIVRGHFDKSRAKNEIVLKESFSSFAQLDARCHALRLMKSAPGALPGSAPGKSRSGGVNFLNVLDVIIILAYFVGMIVLGLIANKKQTGVDDYYLGGRSMGALKIGALWMAGWIGGSSVIGTSSNSYSMGITGVWYVGEIAIGCVLFALVMAKPIKRVSDELRNVTFPELIHARYDQKNSTMASITTILAMIGYTAAQFVAGASILNVLTGWNLGVCYILAAVVIVFYVSTGGLLAVTYTDIVQMALLLLGIVVLAVPLVGSQLHKMGANLVTDLPASFFDLGAWGWPTILALGLSTIMSFFTSMDSYTRCIAARDARTARTGTIYAAVLVFIIAGASTFLGMAGKLILPDLSSSNNVIAALVVELFPHGLKGLVLIGVLSAIMSTADISVLTGSASLTKDIYQRYINPNVSEKTLLHVGLVASLLVGVLGAIFGWFTQDIMNILLITFTINSAGLFLPTLGAFFWKKSCSAGAFASMLSATVIAVVWFIGGKVSSLPLFSIDALWPSFGVSAILYVVICLTHHQTPAEQETAEKFYAAK